MNNDHLIDKLDAAIPIPAVQYSALPRDMSDEDITLLYPHASQQQSEHAHHHVVFDHRLKSYPHNAKPVMASEVAQQNWHLLHDEFSYPIAVLHRKAMEHNHAWLQRVANQLGASLAPEGHTTMSPQLFERQLNAGAWGLTFSSVFQARLGVAAGATRIIITNQVLSDAELDGLASLMADNELLRVWFTIHSMAQVAVLQDWALRRQCEMTFDVLLDISLPGRPGGCRTHSQAMVLANALRRCPELRFAGFECHGGDTSSKFHEHDTARLVDLLQSLIRDSDFERLFVDDEIWISASNPLLFELLPAALRNTRLSRPLHKVLHPKYCTSTTAYEQSPLREADTPSQTSLELWALVHSVPQFGLAMLSCSQSDFPSEMGLPIPKHLARRGEKVAQLAPKDWQIIEFRDPYLLLEYDAHGTAPKVGDRIGLRLPVSCASLNKWHWLPIVEDDWSVSGAISTHF